MYKVHIGYKLHGAERWKRFRSRAKAEAYVRRIFNTTRIVLTIVKGED